jgi:hypothetical protein
MSDPSSQILNKSELTGTLMTFDYNDVQNYSTKLYTVYDVCRNLKLENEPSKEKLKEVKEQMDKTKFFVELPEALHAPNES